MYYGRNAVPISMLQTPCIDGCPNTISWSFEEGEPRTYWEPGYPDTFRPEQGCSEQHLWLLEAPYWYERREGELIRLLWQWEVMTDAARISKWQSQRYLNGDARYYTHPDYQDLLGRGWYA